MPPSTAPMYCFPRLSHQRRIAHILYLCLALLLPGKALAFFAFSVSNTQIENALLLFFPLHNYTTGAKQTLAEPVVYLKKNADRLQLVIPVIVSIPGEERRRGQLGIDIGLHYKASTGELFLGTPRIKTFTMNNISAERYNAFRANFADVLAKTLPLVRIYQVKESNLNHSLAKSEIKSMMIEEGVVKIVIGFQ